MDEASIRRLRLALQRLDSFRNTEEAMTRDSISYLQVLNGVADAIEEIIKAARRVVAPETESSNG